MSAHETLLQCPICLSNGAFDAAESLRNRLIFVSTNKIACPVCQEEVVGLDKLTIHLFSHVKLPVGDNCKYKNTTEETQCNLTQEDKNSKHVNSSHQKKTKQPQAKNKMTTLINSAAAAPVKFVKIYPKLPVVSLGTTSTAEMSPVKTEGAVQPCNQYGNVKTEASNGQTNNTCNICGLQFVDNNILKMHKCLIHNIEENLKQPFTGYNCHLCPKIFKMRGSLMVHLRVAHYGFSSGHFQTETLIGNSNGVDADMQSTDKSISMLKNDNKQWQCDVCRKCFTTKYFLKKHKRLHTGETPYSCAQCNKTFTFQQSYHKHLLYHNDEKPHVCNFCNRAFKELSTLHNHQRIHTGEKPFSCETCGKCFRQRVSYLVHRRIHTGVMPYKCTACEKSFRYKVSQRTHKCQVQPPGTVVRQSGELVEKLKKKHAGSILETGISEAQDIPKTSYLEISEANAEIVRSGAKLSLEDTETEHFTLIADAFESLKEPSLQDVSQILAHYKESDCNLKELLNSNFEELIDEIQAEEKNVPSPSEILNKLCLSQEEDVTSPKENSNSFTNYDILNEFL